MNIVNQQWRLKHRPEGGFAITDFEWTELPVQALETDQVLVRHLYLSLDPTNRLWVKSEDSYLPPVGIGEVMRGVGIGIVEKSRHSTFKAGDLVRGLLGWQTYAVMDGERLKKLQVADDIPLTAFHGVFGPKGITAYFGLMEIGQPKTGETLVVSAAAGAVGSLVGQIGKIEGCHVIGLAGTEEKCKWLVDELGFDAAINYKIENLADSLTKYCPDGIDIYFDNVGGDILDIVLSQINNWARIPLCGLISTYNDKEPRPGPTNMTNVLVRRARLEGFIVADYMSRAQEAINYLLDAYRNGQIKYRIDIVEGLKKAPEAINLLFNGGNTGKLMVKVDPDWPVDE